MSSWRPVKLSEVAQIRHGYAFRGEYFSDDGPGPILLTPGNFAVGGGFKESKAKYYLGPIPEGYLLAAGDLVVTMTDLSKSGDTLGYSAIVPENAKYLHNQRIGLVAILRRERINPAFLYYVMRTPRYRQHVLSGATGSTVRHTSPSRILSYDFRAPELEEQGYITSVLEALDNKQILNDRIVRECDRLRAVSFDRWMKANADRTVERSLLSLARFVNGRAYTKDATGSGRMVIRIAEINSGPGPSTVYNQIDVADMHLARPGDLLFAWSGSLAVARWFRPEAIVNQHIFKVTPVEMPAWMMFELLRRKLPQFQEIAAGKATTMGHIQRHHLAEPVIVPTDDSIGMMDAELAPLWNRALAAEQESLILSALRNTLLPRLMTGEIRVRDAEKTVGDAR